jgi:hypothetical protein
MSQQPDTTTAVAYTVEQIHVSIDLLRESWGWLLELVEPGHASARSAPAVTDEQAERLEALGHSDRAYRDFNLRWGMSALPPSPAAARIAVLDAQAIVAVHVLDAARAVATAGNAVYLGGRPSMAASVRNALDWLDHAVDGLRDGQLAETIDTSLRRADRTARAAAHCLDEDVEPLRDRCPACGRRSLQRELDGATRVVRCVSQSCRCTGDAEPDHPACGCGKERREPGRRHVWLPSEFDGPHGLWAATETAQLAHVRLYRSARGHGGWQSRNMGGAL